MENYSAPIVLFGFLFLLTALLLLTPLEMRITIDNLRHDKSVSGQIVVLWGGRVRFWWAKIALPVAFQTGPFLKECFNFLKGGGEGFRSDKVHLQCIAGAVSRLIRASVWKKIDLQIRLGIDDPARTALLTGFLRYLSGRGLPYLRRLLVFKKGGRPRLLFYPYFPGNEFIFLLSIEFKINSLKFIYHRMKILNSIKQFNGTTSRLPGLKFWRWLGKWQSIQSKA